MGSGIIWGAGSIFKSMIASPTSGRTRSEAKIESKTRDLGSRSRLIRMETVDGVLTDDLAYSTVCESHYLLDEEIDALLLVRFELA